MKIAVAAILTLVSTGALASPDYNCEKSAVHYITSIASAPYVAHGDSVKEKDLQQVLKRKDGDGAESYETFVYKRVDSNEIYTLRLYVEEIGGVCPLQSFKVSSK